MKLILKIAAVLLMLYVLFWGGVAVYFSYAERYKTLLETNLSSVFQRQVSIEDVKTDWSGFSPRVKINGLRVAGDHPLEPAFAFESLNAQVSTISLLRLWPTFTEFTVSKPFLEIVSLENNRLQVAGIELRGKRRDAELTKRILSWLLDQENAAWQAGEIVWRQNSESELRFKDISIVYQRQLQNRKLTAAVVTPKGPLAFDTTINGDLLSTSNWNAELEVQGEDGQRLLKPDDLSVTVENGQGKVLLKTLDVNRIRDFVKLTGLAGAGWLLDAELEGRLHDVHFDFSGPLLSIDNWTLDAAASDIGFQAVGRAPAMNNLNGELKASAKGGEFIFVSNNSEFHWAKLFDQSYPIKRAMGEFSWEIGNKGALTVMLENGEFEDKNARISNINATAEVDPGKRKVSSFGQLFKVESVEDLSFSNGDIVDNNPGEGLKAPIYLDASAEFTVTDMSQLVNYLPNNKALDNFRTWSKKAFLSGEVTNGLVKYQGEVSTTAFAQNRAQLNASADFDNVIVDYAPALNWPAAKRGQGSATIENELLTITPQEIWLNGDPVTDAQLQISSLFQRDRKLSVRGKTTTTLVKGIDFLFKGPLIKPSEQLDELPLQADQGSVDISTQVEMVLNDLTSTRVTGTSIIRDGWVYLPEGVPLENLSATVNFTERSVSSDDVKTTFLGGETQGTVVTTKEAQPPIMKVSASGVMDVQTLQPWVGEHILTWFEGNAPWQGAVLIDGPKLDISAVSDLEGIAVTAPAPLAKPAEQASHVSLSMTVGGSEDPQSLSVRYDQGLSARFLSNSGNANNINEPSLFDNSIIAIGPVADVPLKPGVNFLIQENQIDLDLWLTAIIELADYEPLNPSDNTAFLDAMRSVDIKAQNPVLLNREFGAVGINAVSVDGLNWIGTVRGENVDGTLRMQPRADIGNYDLKLEFLTLGDEIDLGGPPDPIDYSLTPSEFPEINLDIERFRLTGRNLGKLLVSGKPVGDRWSIDQFSMVHNGIRTTATGGWVNSKELGSMSKFEFSAMLDEAEGALNEMDFDGFIKKGEGTVTGNLQWIGAPHEFDYARLNGDFEVFIKDGELVKVEPGSGKLLGLLNFNAIARRLIFDFRDVFASGLKFDRMRYSAVLADGEAIFRDAFIFSPAAFIRMEGKVDLDKELVDLEVHVAPELGGNLALLSALANPTAGAVVFLTQRLFKDEMRKSSFKSYRALGTWEDFEMVEIKDGDEEIEQSAEQSTEPSLEGIENAPAVESIETDSSLRSG